MTDYNEASEWGRGRAEDDWTTDSVGEEERGQLGEEGQVLIGPVTENDPCINSIPCVLKVQYLIQQRPILFYLSRLRQ